VARYGYGGYNPYPTTTTSEDTDVGDSATLDEDGYQEVVATGCELAMDAFFRRVITKLNFQICNDYGVLGLVPLFTGKATKSFADLEKTLKASAPPTECAFVAPAASLCPELGPTCTGAYDAASHRRRTCP